MRAGRCRSRQAGWRIKGGHCTSVADSAPAGVRSGNDVQMKTLFMTTVTTCILLEDSRQNHLISLAFFKIFLDLCAATHYRIVPLATARGIFWSALHCSRRSAMPTACFSRGRFRPGRAVCSNPCHKREEARAAVPAEAERSAFSVGLECAECTRRIGVTARQRDASLGPPRSFPPGESIRSISNGP